MKIALFDDHQIILDTLSVFFKGKESVKIVGIATTKSQVLELLEKYEIDIFIMDVLTDEEIGLSLFEEIIDKKYPVKIVAFTSITSDFVKQSLFEYGIAAFVSKKEPLDELWNAIQSIDLSEKSSTPKKKHEFPQLTIKEKEIARYLVQGLAAKEIAALTNNSVNTINNQKNHLLDKFQCSNSTELSVKLLQLGYLTL